MLVYVICHPSIGRSMFTSRLRCNGGVRSNRYDLQRKGIGSAAHNSGEVRWNLSKRQLGSMLKLASVRCNSNTNKKTDDQVLMMSSEWDCRLLNVTSCYSSRRRAVMSLSLIEVLFFFPA